ncbi:MAG TPA: hypothetical protein VEM41_06880, partial [Actinomycetota bacterium]|nr:hypothetical protein [Actinomycetota bacterium]
MNDYLGLPWRASRAVIRIVLIGFLTAASAALLLTIHQTGASAAACNDNWLGTKNAKWDQATNWDSGVPGTATHVCISSGTLFAPTISAAPAFAQDITLSGATLTVNNTLTVADTSGTGANPSALRLGSTITGSSTVTFATGTTLNWNASGQMLGTGSTVFASGSHVVIDGTGGAATAYDRTITNNGTIT